MLYDHLGRVIESITEDRQERTDNWQNYATGIGTALDKTRAGRFLPDWRISDAEATAMFNGSDIGRKFVEKRPQEMFRQGYELECADVDKSQIEDFRDYCTEEFAVEETAREATIWGRTYGGDLAILGANDGSSDMSTPLNTDGIRDFTYLHEVDRRYLTVLTYYNDPNRPKYGRPETYLITNAIAPVGSRLAGSDIARLKSNGYIFAAIHETRVVRFGGRLSDFQTRQNLAGWDFSHLQLPYTYIRNFDHGFDSAMYLLSDVAQGVLKMKDLIKAISAGKQQMIMQRAMLNEQLSSVMKSKVVDADGEDWERKPTPLTGVPDMLDRLMQRVAASDDYPVIEIFGAGAGGMNAAGEAEATTRKFYDTIATDQKNVLSPRLTRIYRIIGRSRKSPMKGRDVRWKIKFHPLQSPTDAEVADTKLKRAQKDQIYISEGVVQPEVVALTLTDDYPALDVDKIEAAIEGEVSYEPYANDPEPEPPAIVPGADPNAAPAPAVLKAKAAPKPGAPAAAKKTPKPGAKPAPAKP